MPRALNLDKLKAQEQKEKDATAKYDEEVAAAHARKAEHARKAHQARLLTLGQLVEDVFGTMSMVEIAETLAELQGGTSSAVEPYGVSSASTSPGKAQIPAESL